METITICGGGSLGHVVAGWLAAKRKAFVNILTNHPDKWQNELSVYAPDDEVLVGRVAKISSNAQDVIPKADVVLLCLPGFLIAEELKKIKPYLKEDSFVGSIFSSTGFFFLNIHSLLRI